MSLTNNHVRPLAVLRLDNSAPVTSARTDQRGATSTTLPEAESRAQTEPTSPTVSDPAWLGPTAGHEETVALRELAANPLHPRDDWQAEDNALELLGNSLAGPSGQIHPLLCTPLPPDLGVRVIPVTARFLVIDGHRRLAAMERLGMQHARVWVLATPGGEPLTPVERLTRWLLAAASTKKPTTQQTILAIVRLYLDWEHQHSDTGRTRRFPS